MLMLVVAFVLAGWVIVATLLALAVGKAAHRGEVAYQDEMFLRNVALEASHEATDRRLALVSKS